MDKYAVIVAGGSGARMRAVLPKQFMELDGLPILMHTINRFASIANISIILVLPKTEISTWENLVKKHDFSITHQVVVGGEKRFNSVKNGLAKVAAGSLVAIQDGVRPYSSSELINSCFESAEKYGSGIAAVKSKDSIRKIEGKDNKSVDRSTFRLIQTPQTFQTDLIKKAFDSATNSLATDDATIAGDFGIEIRLVNGEYTNLKITTPEDMAIAQALIDNDLVPS